MNPNGIGKSMIIVGAILVLIGVIFMMRDKIPRIGRLPGDACVKRDTFAFYFPITTCIIIRMARQVSSPFSESDHHTVRGIST